MGEEEEYKSGGHTISLSHNSHSVCSLKFTVNKHRISCLHLIQDTDVKLISGPSLRATHINF